MEKEVWGQGVVVEADSGKQNPKTGLFSESSGPASRLRAHPACAVSGQLLFQLSRDRDSTTYPVICSRATPALHLEVLAFKEWRQERGGPKMGRQQSRAEELS